MNRTKFLMSLFGIGAASKVIASEKEKTVKIDQEMIDKAVAKAFKANEPKIEIIGKISGNDIWISHQRTNYNRGLTS